jgi:hypothetical protein
MRIVLRLGIWTKIARPAIGAEMKAAVLADRRFFFADSPFANL